MFGSSWVPEVKAWICNLLGTNCTLDLLPEQCWYSPGHTQVVNCNRRALFLFPLKTPWWDYFLYFSWVKDVGLMRSCEVSTLVFSAALGAQKFCEIGADSASKAAL